jgi:ribose/xylose/arabinose/galactoside ABC-type transport system permease subunit
VSWLNLIVISPLWGMLSAQFLIQIFVFLILFVFALIGLIKGTVPRRSNLASMTVTLGSVAIFTVLFFVGS